MSVLVPNASGAYVRVSGRTDKAVLAVNGFAADGNMFVKKVKQRLEVRISSLVIVRNDVLILGTDSGTVMPIPKICPCVQSRALSNLCSMPGDFSLTTCTIFSEV